MSPDLTDPEVQKKVCDVNGELHTSMLASYFGQWQPRLQMIIDNIQDWVAEGRRILVLSYSIAELVNLFCMWTQQQLYTDVMVKDPKEVGESVEPIAMPPRDKVKATKRLAQIRKLLQSPNLNPIKEQHYKFEIQNIQARLDAHRVWEKIDKENERRKNAHIKKVLQTQTNAGLMIGKIKPEERHRMLQERQVVFAIMRYGLEGLDEKRLDTVAVCEPLSKKGSLQQLMGRVLRKQSGKKVPLVVFFEDEVGPMMGMCRKLRQHLRHWPVDEGGPYEYENIGHPLGSWRKQ